MPRWRHSSLIAASASREIDGAGGIVGRDGHDGPRAAGDGAADRVQVDLIVGVERHHARARQLSIATAIS